MRIFRQARQLRLPEWVSPRHRRSHSQPRSTNLRPPPTPFASHVEVAHPTRAVQWVVGDVRRLPSITDSLSGSGLEVDEDGKPNGRAPSGGIELLQKVDLGGQKVPSKLRVVQV